jgi:hypothetical protein
MRCVPVNLICRPDEDDHTDHALNRGSNLRVVLIHKSIVTIETYPIPDSTCQTLVSHRSPLHLSPIPNSQRSANGLSCSVLNLQRSLFPDPFGWSEFTLPSMAPLLSSFHSNQVQNSAVLEVRCEYCVQLCVSLTDITFELPSCLRRVERFAFDTCES